MNEKMNQSAVSVTLVTIDITLQEATTETEVDLHLTECETNREAALAAVIRIVVVVTVPPNTDDQVAPSIKAEVVASLKETEASQENLRITIANIDHQVPLQTIA